MSAWVSPVCGLAFTMLSTFTASTRFSEGTGSPVNGDRSWRARDGADACPQAASSTVTTPANTTAAATVMTALCLIHLIASSRAAHLTRMHHHTTPLGTTTGYRRQPYAAGRSGSQAVQHGDGGSPLTSRGLEVPDWASVAGTDGGRG